MTNTFDSMDIALLKRLRKVAHDANLANRVESARPDNLCACGNMLVITDRGTMCRQCVLRERIA